MVRREFQKDTLTLKIWKVTPPPKKKNSYTSLTGWLWMMRSHLLWDCSNISLHLALTIKLLGLFSITCPHVIWWCWWVKIKKSCHPEDECNKGGKVFLHFGKYPLVHSGWFSFSIPFLALGMCRPLKSEWGFLTQQQRTNNFIYLPESCPKHSPLITTEGSRTPH